MEGQLDRQVYDSEIKLSKSRPRPILLKNWLRALRSSF